MTAPDSDGTARYVFGIKFRLAPATDDLTLEPAQFEATLYRRADPPGADGWLFFRDHLWHGELSDPEHLRELTAAALGVPVTAVSFRELQTDEPYFEALRAAVGAALDEFNTNTVDQALSRYLGSSIRVVSTDGQPDGSRGR